MAIKNQKEYFNETYKNWQEVSDEKTAIIDKIIKKLGISEGESLLDVASGTGVLYENLKDISLSKYVALDISENMLKELKKLYFEAKTICADFDEDIDLGEKFDFLVIFNSIPHFENLDTVFTNVYKHLKDRGTFAIAHSRTREKLKEHHRNIGYSLGRDAIPSDDTLLKLTRNYGFKECYIEDEEIFFFSCRK
ncbi:class I SAM-dependent DNA methyltransferase [Clostridium cellulovorans]|uniref:Methyltransferase type 11 n=1 Tax=Clostridium cellulovorans (strain ATCC 35296 / DSM 3052 / OCM 3 / 743B) TaxID=573061 RepID=D9SVA6_CLOC7|nr:class I SAM-dependent methyltransferase [Clostridium cellulovorans]ADL53080.1 Methyltransferase type 11 [Clostridium cellulovorans 743B]